jgi:hypothetical protein
MLQLTLQFSAGKDDLKNSLERLVGKTLSLIITDNSASLLSIRTKGNSVAVRMHWMFLNAGVDVIREIAGFIESRRGRTPLVRRFINENKLCLRKRQRAAGPVCIRTQGRFYNLREIFDDINKEYFEGSVVALIGWGKGNSRRVVRKRTLGTYCRHTDAIRINPVLDRRSVPHYLIRYVVYHEMLHRVVGESKNNGRRSVHSPEFRKRERMFKEYAKAVFWEKSRAT